MRKLTGKITIKDLGTQETTEPWGGGENRNVKLRLPGVLGNITLTMLWRFYSTVKNLVLSQNSGQTKTCN